MAGDLTQLRRMQSFDNVSYFTSFHEKPNTFINPQFNMTGAFSESRRQQDTMKYIMKVGMMAGGSAAFGVVIGMFMSSFEFNSTMGVDTDRSTRSQLKQHFHGYARFLKRQALSMGRFGLYIALCEVPLEMVVGKMGVPTMFVSGGLAACLQMRWPGFGPFMSTFVSSGCMIGALSLFIHRGHD